MKLSVSEYLVVVSAFFITLLAAHLIYGLPAEDAATEAKSLLAARPGLSDEFACRSPSHHDGDAIRCSMLGRSMRLYGIDAPEMPGACRPGRRCTPGDPYAARDHLAALTRGQSVHCRQVSVDRYDRKIVQCRTGSGDLSCAMVRAGHAVKRYGVINC